MPLTSHTPHLVGNLESEAWDTCLLSAATTFLWDCKQGSRQHCLCALRALCTEVCFKASLGGSITWISPLILLLHARCVLQLLGLE